MAGLAVRFWNLGRVLSKRIRLWEWRRVRLVAAAGQRQPAVGCCTRNADIARAGREGMANRRGIRSIGICVILSSLGLGAAVR